MNERFLRRLMSRVVMLCLPLGPAALGAACSSSGDGDNSQDPCVASNTGVPGCGGGVCVHPDAGTEAFGDGGFLVGAACVPFCGGAGSVCQLVASSSQGAAVRCSSPCTGRRPAGLADEPATCG